MFKTVLFPIDQTRESRQAAEVVANVVKTYSSRLIILSVVEIPEEGAATNPEMTSAEAIAKLLEDAKNLFQSEGIDSETMERQGKPAFTICDVADEIESDLIIMGCRGIGLTEEGVTDSVSNRVINLAPCPVLVVP
ncbi:MAG: universal stress protein [Leptolyngbyaceae cyanobacterium SM1_4_3]|nr:universal stress protein [Leptolyngbyaceae cyanobacterium SM1_4_3]